VSVLFVDLVGYTHLSERLEADELNHVVERCFGNGALGQPEHRARPEREDPAGEKQDGRHHVERDEEDGAPRAEAAGHRQRRLEPGRRVEGPRQGQQRGQRDEPDEHTPPGSGTTHVQSLAVVIP
jgi:hypothetical protein